MSNKLHKLTINDVPANVTEKELQLVFGKYGTVENVAIDKGTAVITLFGKNLDFIDSSGIGELPLPNGTALRVLDKS